MVAEDHRGKMVILAVVGPMGIVGAFMTPERWATAFIEMARRPAGG